MLLLSLAAVPLFIPPAHAMGSLFINPPSQPVALAGTPVTYQVKVANFDPFNAWDIMVGNSTSSLSPLSISIAGNLLKANYSATVQELINCVNGTGTGCTIDDGPGVVHSAAVMYGAPPQTGPSSGLLFTISYTATGGPGTTLHIFNDVIPNGTPNPVPHTTSDGTYGKPKPDVFTTFKPTSLNLIAGRTGTSNFTFASLNFTGDVNLAEDITPPGANGVTVSFSSTPVRLVAGQKISTLLTVSTTTTTPAMGYQVRVNATVGTILHTFFVSVFVSPPRPDMFITSLSVSPSSVTVGQSVRVTLTVLNNGTISGDYQLQVLWGNFVVSRPNGTLPMNDPQQLNVPWDTSRFPAGTFAVTATVVTVSGQTTRQFTGPALTLSPAPSQPASVDPLLVGGVAGVIFLIVLFAFFRRKKPEEKKTKRVTR